MKKVELLAPAGNFDCLKSAINNGADAVYLGGKNFSARAFANNFDKDELKQAVEYAHLRNVKVYVTLNTLLTEKEFSNAIKLVDYYYSINVDALLIQDFGLYYWIKKKYPDFELHCSTQMHVHNIEGIRTAKKLGFKRVVIARESTLEFIKEACKQDIEIETFVHGAICVSYSGQCLMSSITKNRSANKGMCAQCCRLKYDLYDRDDNKLDTDTDYILSPKDMCLIDDIPDLIEAGVSSFKIEGRLKSSAYVGYVTSLYRKAIDSYYEGKKYNINSSELENLKVLFNRNFTNDLLFGKGNLFGQQTPNHLGIEIGNAFKYDNGFIFIKLNKELNQFDGIRIGDFGCIVNMLYKDGLLVNKGKINDIVYIKCDEKHLGKVYKTLDYELENSINTIADKRIPINMKIDIYPDRNVLVDISDGNLTYKYVSETVSQIAKNSPLTEESIINQFSKLNETVYYLNKAEVNTNNAFLPVKELNEIRRKAIELFNIYRLDSFKRNSIDCNYATYKPTYQEEGDILVENDSCTYKNTKYDVNYVINRESSYSTNDNVVISEIGGLLSKNKNKLAYYTLNCSNSYCYEFLKKLGFECIMLSTELKELDIDDLVSSYKLRNGIDIKPYILKQGNKVLMYIRTNPFDKYIQNTEGNTIKDNNNSYLIRHNHGITEIIENSENTDDLVINKQMFTIYK